MEFITNQGIIIDAKLFHWYAILEVGFLMMCQRMRIDRLCVNAGTLSDTTAPMLLQTFM